MQLLERLTKRRRPASRAALLLKVARYEIRQGRFQRSMALIAAFSAVVSGFEAYAQHQRGAFRDRWMWTPVALTPAAVVAAGAAVIDEHAAQTALPAVALAALTDGIIGFALHVRGVTRMPGGFKLGQYNIVMGPPIFAPLLVGITGVLGLFAAALRPEAVSHDGLWRTLAILRPNGRPETVPHLFHEVPHAGHANGRPGHSGVLPDPLAQVERAVAHGRFQQGMALVSATLAVLAGGEAYFEHLRGSYNQRWMWTPVWVTPPMAAAALAAAQSPRVARHVLPIASAVTMFDGLLGFFLHLRGLRHMPGRLANLRFNITMGPPLFAPLLFCAVGLLGLIASLLRRE
jgi:hypothetical protein